MKASYRMMNGWKFLSHYTLLEIKINRTISLENVFQLRHKNYLKVPSLHFSQKKTELKGLWEFHFVKKLVWTSHHLSILNSNEFHLPFWRGHSHIRDFSQGGLPNYNNVFDRSIFSITIGEDTHQYWQGGPGNLQKK